MEIISSRRLRAGKTIVLCVASLFIAGSSSTTGEPQEVALSAFTAPSKEIEIAAARGGVIEKVFFEEGSQVGKGERVVALKSDIEQAQLAVAKARAEAAQLSIDAEEAGLLQAQRERDRLERRRAAAGEASTVSETDIEEANLKFLLAGLRLENARSAERIAQLNADLARAVLNEMTVRAPEDGEILLVHKHAGEAVEEHAPLAKLVNVNTLDVVAFAPVGTLGKIKPGMKAEFVGEKLPDLEVPCTVFLVDVVANAGLYRVKARIDNRRRKVPAGIRGKIVLEIDR